MQIAESFELFEYILTKILNVNFNLRPSPMVYTTDRLKYLHSVKAIVICSGGAM